MKVVTLDPKEKETTRRKNDMLEVLEDMRKQIEDGEITEFVACSMTAEGFPQIHANIMDFPGGVGLFEIGKHLLITQEA